MRPTILLLLPVLSLAALLGRPSPACQPSPRPTPALSSSIRSLMKTKTKFIKGNQVAPASDSKALPGRQREYRFEFQVLNSTYFFDRVLMHLADGLVTDTIKDGRGFTIRYSMKNTKLIFDSGFIFENEDVTPFLEILFVPEFLFEEEGKACQTIDYCQLRFLYDPEYNPHEAMLPYLETIGDVKRHDLVNYCDQVYNYILKTKFDLKALFPSGKRPAETGTPEAFLEKHVTATFKELQANIAGIASMFDKDGQAAFQNKGDSSEKGPTGPDNLLKIPLAKRLSNYKLHTKQNKKGTGAGSKPSQAKSPQIEILDLGEPKNHKKEKDAKKDKGEKNNLLLKEVSGKDKGKDKDFKNFQATKLKPSGPAKAEFGKKLKSVNVGGKKVRSARV